LFFQEFLHIVNELHGDDHFSSQDPQAFEKYGQPEYGTEDDGVHKHPALYNEINHTDPRQNGTLTFVRESESAAFLITLHPEPHVIELQKVLSVPERTRLNGVRPEPCRRSELHRLAEKAVSL
jgi:hypothetical protein